MLTQTWDYSSGTGFSYDPSKIGFPGGTHAALLLVDGPPQTNNEDISAATFDPALLAFGSGTLHQLDQRPAHATFYAGWSAVVGANWGNGSTTITPANGAAIVGGVLDLTGATNKHVSFSAVGNADSLLQGTVEFQVTPNYSGTPSTIQTFFLTAASSSSGEALVTIIEHFTDGSFYMLTFDETGTNVMLVSAPWSPVAGTTYTVRAQYDGIGGLNKIFIDGVLFASLNQTWTRAGAITVGEVGFRTDVGLPANANFKIANLAFYDALVTPASPVLAPTIYPATTADLPPFSYGGLGSLQAFTSFSTTDTNAPHYTLNGRWWDGAAWSTSDGSYAQSNPAATANANIADLPASNSMQINAVFPGGSVSATLAAAAFQYIIQEYSTSDPTISPVAPIGVSALLDFVAVAAASGSDGVGWVLQAGSSPLWWNGTAWVASDLSFAQSNPPATVLAHASALPGLSPGFLLTPIAVLHSAAGTTTPTLTSLTVDYELFVPEPAPPPQCTVYVFLKTLLGMDPPPADARLLVQTPAPFSIDGTLIQPGTTTLYCDSRGECQGDLVITATLGIKLFFQVAYLDANRVLQTATLGWALVPNQPTADLSTFTFTARPDE